MDGPLLAVHGGAGAIRRGGIDEAKAKDCLAAALVAGWQVVGSGGAALDAVEAAVRVLEEGGVFNAGRGGSRASDGRIQLDAALMDGATGAAGAVAAVRRLRHPVSAARLVMTRSPHVLLVGEGAEDFARAQGAATVDDSWFVAAPPSATPGTVGSVARDRAGHLAAATSTGGTRGKLPGRVGDCPLIGAGTWADGKVAISATGVGEYFIRAGFARAVAAAVQYTGIDPGDACRQELDAIKARGGDGGCIALGSSGGPALPFVSIGMHRGWIGADGTPRVACFADEDCGPWNFEATKSV